MEDLPCIHKAMGSGLSAIKQNIPKPTNKTLFRYKEAQQDSSESHFFVKRVVSLRWLAPLPHRASGKQWDAQAFDDVVPSLN